MAFDPNAPFEVEGGGTPSFDPGKSFSYDRLPDAEPPDEPTPAPRRSYSDYAKVSPPPDEYAPIVAAAAEKYGVPLRIAHWTGSRESGWNPQAVGIPTSSGRAQGAWQFMPGTAKEMGLADPHDFASSTDAAMRYLRKLYEASGRNWEDAVAKYGTFSTGQGPEADAAVRRGYREYMASDPDTSTWRDVIQGIGRGAISGAASVAGLPSDAANLADRAYQWLLTAGAEKLGLLTPEQGEELRKPLPGEEREWTSEKLKERLLHFAGYLGADTTPPVTRAGRIAETATSFAPMGALGASSLREVPGAMAMYGALPGAASETAGLAFEGSPLETPARIIGGIGGAAPGIVGDFMRATPRTVSQGIRDLTPDQQREVSALLEMAKQSGAPLTVPEAVQHVTKGATTLGDMQRVVEQTRTGAPIMRKFYAERPVQNEALARRTFDKIGAAPTVPEEIPTKVQDAASAFVGNADKLRTSAVDTLYKAASLDRVPTSEMNAFMSRLDGMIASDKTGILRKPLMELRDALTEKMTTPKSPPKMGNARWINTGRIPITDVENIDRVRKYFRDKIDLPAWAQDAIPKEEGAKIGSLLGDLRSMMEKSSPSFASGRGLYEQITRDAIKPLLASPTGKLAGADSFDKQAAILFAPKPLPGSEKGVSDAIRSVVRKDPQAAEGMVRLYLERQFDEASQALRSGPNEWGGAAFRAVTVGNKQQAKNLEAAVKALPNGELRWTALDKAMKVFAAQGRRQPMGSATEFNRLLTRQMEEGTPVGAVLATAGSPTRWASFFDDMYREFRFGKNSAELAKAFTSGDLNALRALARSPGPSIQAQAALAIVLGKRAVEGVERAPQPAPQP